MSKDRRVLIVEDEALIAFLLEEMIHDLGYEVAAVANSLSKAMATEPASFDMAILDVQLNGEQVYPFAQTLTARGTPYAFATGNGGSDIPEAHRGALLLQKPFQQESLKRVLDRMAGV
ncbi:MAG TPA: response regulator [Rhizomicrobium sp.]